MKYFVLIILFFAALSFAQVGKYTHIVAGSFNKAGQRLANGFACWDKAASRYSNLPRATTFTGGAVADIAPAGRGFLAVGDFTGVNGLKANGIAFFDGSKWCALPHLNLYYYAKPFPVPNPIQFPYDRAQTAGSASAIAQIGNDYYVFGGQVGAGPAQRTRFNQVGNLQTGVAGLVKLTFDGTANFTVSTMNYETAGGRGTANVEPNNPGFPADFAPSGTIGRTKARAAIINSVFNIYVHPNVGTASDVWRWRTGDTQWLRVTEQGPQTWNVSSTLTNFFVQAQAISGQIVDFDHDGTNIVVVGRFDNSGNTTASVNYVNVARSTDAAGTSVTWTSAVNWPNVNNFNQTNSQAFRVAYEPSGGVFYVASTFTSVDATTTGDKDLLGVAQYFIYRVSGGSPTALGAASPRFDLPAGNPSFNRLQFYNSRLYVFGNFAYYTWFNNQNNRWPRHYTRCISNAVYYDGSDFIDAYGGFTALGNAYPLIASTSGADFLYVPNAANFYDTFSAGSVVAYNKDTKRWVNLASQRFTKISNTPVATAIKGDDGNVGVVHFISKQRPNVNDAVVVAGEFDWYGNQYLASVAFLRTSTGTYEQIGGGLFVEENTALYQADQTQPIYRAGRVWDIEEIDGKFYAGGEFTKNTQGACLNNLASVSATNTGDVWTALGAGCDGAVRDLIAKGNDLYVGGEFSSCAGVDGTRRVARYDTKKGTWWALQEGLEGTVHAMIWYRGNLLVGGAFTGGNSAPASYRSANTGLWEWNGNRWAPLTTRCLKDCDGVSPFNFPFASRFDPASRSVDDVRSLRTIGGNLYILGSIPAPNAATNVLIQYDGNTFKQYGAASSGTVCQKQGCLASNNSEVIALFTRGNNLNQNYMQYNPDRQNWVDTYTGFDNAPIIVASASYVTLSLFSLFLIILLAF